MMDRKSLLGLVGGIALVGAAAFTWQALLAMKGNAIAYAADGETLLPRRPADAPAGALLPAPDAGAVTPLTRRGALAELAGHAGAHAFADADLAALTPEQKAINKLQKKLDKLEHKADKTEAKLATLNEALQLAEAALADALAMSDGPEKDKALAKAQKKLAKLQNKADKAAAKLQALEDAQDEVTNEIVLLDPDHFEDVQGLSAPEQMAVVTAGDAGIGGGGGSFKANFLGGSYILGPDDFPGDSDFVTDKTNSYVYDPSMDVLGMVNQILCMLAQTKYDEMVNQGTYIAQVDEAACDSGKGNESSGEKGQSAGGAGELPALWVLHSEREDDLSDEIVKAWVPNENDGDHVPATIRAKLLVHQGVSDVDPFGSFGLNFAGVPLGGTLDDALEHGFLKTLDVMDGFIGFSLMHAKGDLNAEPFPENENAEIVQANVNMFDDQSEGVARIRRQWRENWGGEQGDTGVQTDEFLLSFNDQTVLRGKNGDQGECLSRTDFDKNVWRYNLYEAEGDSLGARVERNGGFGIKTAGGKYGWIGYYGLWLPQGVDLQTGDVVTQSSFGGAEVPYTVLSSPGKLIRNTRKTLLLADADGESFSWWDFPQPGGGQFGDPPPQPTQYRVIYDVLLGQFLKIGTIAQNGGEFTPFGEAVPIDVQGLGGFLNMWSDSLGGSVSYVDADDHITFYAQTFVNGADPLFDGGDDVAFYGFMDCLDHGVTGAEAEQGQVFLPNSFDVASPHQFLFRRADLTLYDDADGTGASLAAAGLAPGEQPMNGPFTWGMRSGPMLTSTEGLADTFALWSQPVFYTYETGANSWNHYATVVDGDGNAVAFDPPLQFSYMHTTENDANADSTYNGKTFLLSYNGNGDLGGIPNAPADLDGDGQPDRWYPLFAIADGVLMGPTGTEYVIRAMQQELTLRAAPGGCSGQTIGPVATLPLPEESEYVPPDIGPKPLVLDPPAVIAGEVQGP